MFIKLKIMEKNDKHIQKMKTVDVLGESRYLKKIYRKMN